MKLPANIPLTMSSLEIAGLTGKRHLHILRDIRKMLSELDQGETTFGSTYLDAQGKEHPAFNLPRRECLVLVTGYSVRMRAAVIDRWQVLEAAVAGAVAVAPSAELDQDARRAIGGIIKGIVHRELAEIIPALVRDELASKSLPIRIGKTAGMIWDTAGLPKLKNGAVWLGNRLAEMGCRIEHGGRADMGGKAVRLFDPDKADVCMRNGLRITAERYAAERKGQTALRLVPKKP